MRLIKRWFGVLKQKKPKKQRIAGIAEAKRWLEAKARDAEMMTGLEPVMDELASVLQDFDISLKRLEDAKVPEDAFPRLKKLGAVNRENMTKHLRFIYKALSEPPGQGFSPLMGFYTSSVGVLKEHTEQSLRSHYYVKALFSKEANEVIVDVKRLEKTILKLKQPLEERKKRTDLIDRCLSELESLEEDISRVEKIEKEIASCDSEIRELEHERALLKEKLDRIKAGDEWQEYRSLKHELVEVSSSIEAVERECSEFFSPFGKAVDKIGKLASSGRYPLSERQKAMIEKEFIEYDSKEALEFADWIARMASEGSLRLKKKLRSRLEHKLPFFKVSLGRYQKTRSALAKRKKEMEKKIEALDSVRQVQAIEWKLSRIEKDLKAFEQGVLDRKKSNIEEGILEREERIRGLLKEIQGEEVDFSLRGNTPQGGDV